MTVEVDAAIAALERLAGGMDDACREIAIKGALLIEAATKPLVPRRERSDGSLARSIRPEGPYPAGPDAWGARVGPTMIYGRQRELGGHIYPVRARALRWVDSSGVEHFAQHVYQHPEPYLKPGTMAARPAIYAMAAETVAAVIVEGG